MVIAPEVYFIEKISALSISSLERTLTVRILLNSNFKLTKIKYEKYYICTGVHAFLSLLIWTM